MAKPLVLGWAAFLFLLETAGWARADYIIPLTTTGWYDSTGRHLGGWPYFVGQYEGKEYRNYFTFDLSQVKGKIMAAELVLYNPSSDYYSIYHSPDPQEILALHGFTTPYTSSNGKEIFANLGTGSLYGSQTISANDTKDLHILLNDSAVRDLQISNSLFTIGGRLATLDGSQDQYLFPAGPPDPPAFLVLTTDQVARTPEPSSLAMLALGAAGLAGAAWSRRARTLCRCG